MKRSVYLALFMAIAFTSALAQADLDLIPNPTLTLEEINTWGKGKYIDGSNEKSNLCLCNCGNISSSTPLIIVTGRKKEIVLNGYNNVALASIALGKFDKQGIEDITVLKNQAAIDKYGEAAKGGVIKIKFSAKFFREGLKALKSSNAT